MTFMPAVFSAAVTTNQHAMSFLERISPPEDISVHGKEIDSLFYYITGMNSFFFALVCLGLFGFSYLYSAKRNKTAYYTYGNKKKHIWVVTGIGAAVFFLIDANITRMANDDYVGKFINFPKGKETVKVQIMAQQWMWNIRYAGRDEKFNTDDDIVTTNDLRLPINKKIVVQLISKDVIHSFFLPNVRRKVDAMPGRISRIWFQLTKTGKFEIACAEMCGTHHYLMRGEMTVYTEEEYQDWLNQAHSIALAEIDTEDPSRYWGWKWEE